MTTDSSEITNFAVSLFLVMTVVLVGMARGLVKHKPFLGFMKISDSDFHPTSAPSSIDDVLKKNFQILKNGHYTAKYITILVNDYFMESLRREIYSQSENSSTWSLQP